MSSFQVNQQLQGVYVNQHLNFGIVWEGLKRKAKVANRTREIRPSGMKAGAYGNMNY